MGFHQFMDYGKINLDMEIKIRKTQKAKGLLTSILGLPQSQTWNKIPILGQLIYNLSINH